MYVGLIANGTGSVLILDHSQGYKVDSGYSLEMLKVIKNIQPSANFLGITSNARCVGTVRLLPFEMGFWLNSCRGFERLAGLLEKAIKKQTMGLFPV